ncbi:MAG: diaminopimelate decarboxylase [Candidatus Firestonebacteria bacterium]
MKRLYEKPILIEQNIGSVNKFQVGYHEKETTEIDGVPIKDIIARYGSPCFVFSEKKIRETIRNSKKVFKAYYPKVVFGWSYKTNYLGAVCSIFHQEGSLAEVVSQFEYEKARNLGVSGEKIIFNGPNKSAEILERAAKDGAMINIDNFDEIYRLEEIATKLNKKIDVGLRLSLDAGIFPAWNRFGFNYESTQAFSAAKRIHKGGKLNLTGLHCHIGTFILTTKAYRLEVEKLLYFSSILKKELKITLDYIDIGGGFPSRNKLKGIYLPPDVTVPPVEEFAKAISALLLEKTSPGELPTIYIESGRAMIDEAGYLLASVTGSKRLPTGRKAYIIDAGVNLLVTTNWYDIPVKVGIDIEGPAEDVTLYGPLCMNIDIVRETVKLPPLATGTPLVFHPAGAYCVTQWMQFIEYRPNIVLISEKKEMELIREKEKLEDITGKERIPERLKVKF